MNGLWPSVCPDKTAVKTTRIASQKRVPAPLSATAPAGAITTRTEWLANTEAAQERRREYLARVEANREAAALAVDANVVSAARANRAAKREFYRQRALVKSSYSGPRGDGFTVPPEHRAFLREQREMERQARRDMRTRDQLLAGARYRKIERGEATDKTLSQMNKMNGKQRQKWTADRKSDKPVAKSDWDRKQEMKKRRGGGLSLPFGMVGAGTAAKHADKRISGKRSNKKKAIVTPEGVRVHQPFQHGGVGSVPTKDRRGIATSHFVSLEPKEKVDYTVAADGTLVYKHPQKAGAVVSGGVTSTLRDDEEVVEGTGITWGDI